MPPSRLSHQCGRAVTLRQESNKHPGSLQGWRRCRPKAAAREGLAVGRLADPGQWVHHPQVPLGCDILVLVTEIAE